MTVYADPGYIADVVGTSGRIEATWGNAVRDRLVHRFASAAARDAAITVPTEGMLCYVTADNCYYGYSGSTWLAKDLIPQTWTPGVFQPGAITTSGAIGSYMRDFGKCRIEAYIPITGTGTANNVVIIDVPVSSIRTSVIGGSGMLYDSSAGLFYPFMCTMTTTANMQMKDTTQATLLNVGQTGSAFSAGLGSGDLITYTFEYDTV